MRRPFLASVMILLASAASGAEICVTDSIRPAEGASPKQRAFLHDACWKPAAFTMAVKETKNPAPYQADALITFPSPKPGGTPQRDLVTAHWYKARDAGGNLIPAGAPCVVVVHSLHPDMADGLILSRMLARNGVHALMVELPGFGSRKTEPDKGAGVEMTEHGAQSVADVRRARDAACALPGVKKGAPVAIEGLSLGSMVASAAAGLDNAFSPVVLVVGGGDPVTVLEKGRFDAAWLRDRLAKSGHTGAKLRTLLDPIDPLLVAGRINPDHCWMYRAAADGVFPKECGDRLEKTIGLPAAHVTTKPGNHYAAMTWLPEIADFIAREAKRNAQGPAANPH